MNKDSLLSRYGFKLLASIGILLFNTGLQTLLMRSWSTEEYGYMTFNLNVFTNVVNILNMSSSDALFSKLSKRREEKGLVQFYLLHTILLFLFMNVVFVIIAGLGIVEKIWENQPIFTVFLSMQTAFTIFIVTVLTCVSDANLMTRNIEINKVFQKGIVFVGSSLFIFIGRLSLNAYYLLQLSSTIIIICNVFHLYRKKGIIDTKNLFSLRLLKKYYPEFVAFCLPIMPMLFIGSIMSIFENWAIVEYNNISEQAYYGLSVQVQTALTYLFSPISILLIREFAVVVRNKDMLGLNSIYRKFSSLVYVLSAYFTCFIFVESYNTCVLFGGDAYAGADTILKVMMIYVLGQPLGQINGSFCIATEQTRRYSFINLMTMVLRAGMIWLLLIPNAVLQKPLGGVGLISIMIITQLVSTNGLMVENCRDCKSSYAQLVLLQLGVPTIFMVLATVASMIADVMLEKMIVEYSVVVDFLIAGFVYTMLCVPIVYMTLKRNNVQLIKKRNN